MYVETFMLSQILLVKCGFHFQLIIHFWEFNQESERNQEDNKCFIEFLIINKTHVSPSDNK